MTIAFGCDHAGFLLKQRLMQEIRAAHHDVLDCGAVDDSPSDYTDFARRVGEAILQRRAQRGVVVCGSGVGASIAANKIPGVRAAICHDNYSARQGVEHDAMNVLCLGARVVGSELAAELVRTFLNAEFSGAERHVRRLEKITSIERDARAGIYDPQPAGNAT
jgi:ribose 5-phosphate isomerase B